jgi:hypothetical protein
MRQALSLVLYFLRRRRRLDHAREVLQGLASGSDQERLTREASYIYLAARRRDDGDVLRGWMDALLQAAEKIESDRRDAARYAVIAATPTDEDREWIEAAERAAADQWREP